MIRAVAQVFGRDLTKEVPAKGTDGRIENPKVLAIILFVDAIRSVGSIAELLGCIGDLSFWLAFLMRPCPACTVSERWASTYRARMCIVHGVICIDKVWHFATRAVQRACCSSHSAGSYKSLTTLSIGDQLANHRLHVALVSTCTIYRLDSKTSTLSQDVWK